MATQIGIIGYGEAGHAFGAGLVQAGAQVVTYDILVGTAADETIRQRAINDGVRVCESASDAVAESDIIFSLVPADAARAAAESVVPHLVDGQLFMDLNSVSPREKKIGAALVSAAGGRYVEAAIMAPVTSGGVATEILLAGPPATQALDMLEPFGMNLAIVGDQYGAASTVKLCRSVVIKGIEAIVVESMLAARRFGADKAVLASLQKSDPEIDWTAKANYVFERVLQHGRRRAAEMRFAGQAVADAGYPPLMSEAIAAVQDSLADFADADPSLKGMAEYAQAADLIGSILEARDLDLDDLMAEEEA